MQICLFETPAEMSRSYDIWRIVALIDTAEHRIEQCAALRPIPILGEHFREVDDRTSLEQSCLLPPRYSDRLPNTLDRLFTACLTAQLSEERALQTMKLGFPQTLAAFLDEPQGTLCHRESFLERPDLRQCLGLETKKGRPEDR